MANSSKYQVNLDALIPRADLFERADSIVADTSAIRVSDLEPGVVYDMLRKPDFQRETSSWSPKQVARLIETFSMADIIPSVILWQNGNKIFIVDGAHRLSALVAWIRDDYGNGKLSSDFFGGKIPDQQKLLDEETRTLVNNTVGPWKDYKKGGSMLNMKDVQIQWLKSPKAEQAAAAFIRINEGGTVIDPLEARILRAKRSALSIATRIISRGGTGHEYWNHFTDTAARERAPKLGAEIYKLMFSPTLEMPIKTMDVPMAGFGYGVGVLRLAFDLVGLANDLDVPDSSRSKGKDNDLADDLTGTDTVAYLLKVKRALQLVLSNEKLSLGLHPALYFYSGGGAFQPAALHNAVAWLMTLEKRSKIKKFLRVRRYFENLMLTHPVITKPATHKLGSGDRTRSKMLALFERAMDLLAEDRDLELAWKKLSKEFPYLAVDEAEQKAESKKGTRGKPFSSGAKSAATFAELSSVSRCAICGGLLHKNGKVVDHKEPKSSGGSSASVNARWVHPVCNSNRQAS
jgi:hypothetical protein